MKNTFLIVPITEKMPASVHSQNGTDGMLRKKANYFLIFQKCYHFFFIWFCTQNWSGNDYMAL